LDKLIFKNKLNWISYNEFKNVEYIDKGGFGTILSIHKVIWEEEEVALKCVNNLNENLDEFINEV
jgi:hypothetical protein